MSEYHTPVLLDESVSALITNPSGIYIDATFGGGGHTAEILSRLSPAGKVIAFDRDSDAINNRIDDPRLILIRADFRYIHNFVMLETLKGTVGNYSGGDLNAEAKVDGVLADLGVSSHQFDTADRGFSFRFDAPLDMRMNKRGGDTAADLLNKCSEEELADMFYLYGELKNSRRIAPTIVKARGQKPFETTQDLIDATQPLFPKERGKKEMAKLFQALRIVVNHEMSALREMLEAATELLKPGGRLSVITYHSLEDRIVKNMMKAGNPEGKMKQDFFGRVETPFKLVNNKVIVPDEDEQERNPRSRSAKLRIAEKK